MNIVSRKLLFVLLSATVLFAGCAKKPKRPDPSSTVLGPSTGGNLTPTDAGTFGDLNTGLDQRDAGWDAANQNRTLLQPVYFDFDRFDIKASERPKLEAAVQYLKDHPDHRVLLEGHCDWRGTEEYNLGLGDRRANAAKQFLSKLSVDGSKLETLSKGSLDSVKNADDTTAAKDRRVELVVVKQP